MLLRLLFISALLTGLARAETPPAPAAFEGLPIEQLSRAAIIVGRGGRPLPEQWTVVTFDPKAPNGVREYLLAGDEIIRQRAESSLAEKLTADDVLGVENVAVDPLTLAGLAQQFAAANQVAVASMDFDLRKNGSDATPLWTVICLGGRGEIVGQLVVTGRKGQIVSHEGFEVRPPPAPVPSEVAEADTAAEEMAEEPDHDEPPAATKSGSTAKKKTASKSSSSKKSNSSSGAAKPFRKVGGKLQKFFTGKDTISR